MWGGGQNNRESTHSVTHESKKMKKTRKAIVPLITNGKRRRKIASCRKIRLVQCTYTSSSQTIVLERVVQQTLCMQFSTLLLLTFWVKSWCSLNACFVLLGCYHFPHTTYVCVSVSVCLFCLLWVFCVVKFIFDWLWIAHMPTKNHGVDINKTNRCFSAYFCYRLHAARSAFSCAPCVCCWWTVIVVFSSFIRSLIALPA